MFAAFDEVNMAAPLGSAAKVVLFEKLQRCVTSFRVAGVALSDIPTWFIAATALWRPLSSFCVAGAPLSTCRAGFLCESHCQGCIKWCQRANSVAGLAF